MSCITGTRHGRDVSERVLHADWSTAPGEPSGDGVHAQRSPHPRTLQRGPCPDAVELPYACVRGGRWMVELVPHVRRPTHMNGRAFGWYVVVVGIGSSAATVHGASWVEASRSWVVSSRRVFSPFAIRIKPSGSSADKAAARRSGSGSLEVPRRCNKCPHACSIPPLDG